MPFELTTLRCAGAKNFGTKKFAYNLTSREWLKTAYGAGMYFHPQVTEFNALAELAEQFEKVHRDPRAVVVRGKLRSWVRDAMRADPSLKIWRRSHDKPTQVATLDEQPLPWIMLDFDSLPLRDCDDLVDDPESAIDHAIHDYLPEPFHDAECWWQLSASCGFVPGILKCHLLFWLDKPGTNQEIKRSLRPWVTDMSPFSAAQPHYIAAPVVQGAADPLPRRTGWRKGSEPCVTLPPPPERQSRSGATGEASADMPRSIEEALASLGDGEGFFGFHEPLRNAIWLYAVQCSRSGKRDDEPLLSRLREAIENAPHKADRDISAYLSDDYLQKSLDGAFAKVNKEDDEPPVTPHHTLPTATLEEARKALDGAISKFLAEAGTYLAQPEDDKGVRDNPPPHYGIAVTVGAGKSTRARKLLPEFIARQKAAGCSHRVLWLVPTHRLGNETLEAMRQLGINAAIWRGRQADDPDQTGSQMCRDLDAVKAAQEVGAAVGKSVCRYKDKQCPFFSECGYQRQKVPAESADIVIAANEGLFHRLPSSVTDDLACVIVDESWWQDGITLAAPTRIENFADVVISHPVLSDSRLGAEMDTNDLHTFASKAQRAFERHAKGDLVSREAVAATGVTAEDCAAASKLEWRRKVDVQLYPGMPASAREEAVQRAAVNKTLSRRAAIWRHLRELLEGDQSHTGRLEIGTREGADGISAVVLSHGRRAVREQLAALPILYLDATMEPEIIRHYLPTFQVTARIQVAQPHVETVVVKGSFSKASLKGRHELVAELADFCRLNSDGDALVITHGDIEQRFTAPGVRTGHFNAMSGLDQYRNVSTLLVIGRPLASPEMTCRMARALTGRPIAVQQTDRVTRGQLMVDGTARPMRVLGYDNPDLEMIRAAVTDAELVQGAGRGRGVNREKCNPLLLVVMAGDCLYAGPANRVVHWNQVKPGSPARLLARGLLPDSPSDAWKLAPDLWPSVAAAKMAFYRGISVTSPYEEYIIRKCYPNPPAKLLKGRYRPEGRGQQVRNFVALPWFKSAALSDWLSGYHALGPLATFEMDHHAQAEQEMVASEPLRPYSPLAALGWGLGLPVRAEPLDEPEPNSEGERPVFQLGCYGELLAPEAMFPKKVGGPTIPTLAVLRNLKSPEPAQPEPEPEQPVAPELTGGYGDLLLPANMLPVGRRTHDARSQAANERISERVAGHNRHRAGA